MSSSKLENGTRCSFNRPLNNWNVSKVTNMYRVFNNANSFNQPLNNWNVSNVREMGGMFSGATSFNQPLGVSVAASGAAGSKFARRALRTVWQYLSKLL